MLRIRQKDGTWVNLGNGRARRSLFRFDSAASAMGPFQQPLARDLIRIGSAFFLADRYFRRPRHLGQRCRALEIEVEVEALEACRGVADEWDDWANFVTHDNWRVRFVRAPARARRRSPEAALVPGCDAIALFSGGLDSLCGAAMMLRQGMNPLFVTHSPPGRQAVAQLLASLRRNLDLAQRVDPWVSFRLQAIPYTRHGSRSLYPERSRRTRAVLFLSLAGAVAIETGIPRLFLNENGVMAVNLPMRPFNTGMNISRHAHPQTLRRFEAILGRLWPWGGTAPEVRNLLAGLTKEEAVRLLRHAAPLATATLTCENAGQQIAMLRHHFAGTKRGLAECGLCLPCLVRRSALAGAGVVERADHYAFSLADAARPRRAAEGAPMLAAVRDNPVMLEEFCRRLVRMQPAEFLEQFTYELALLPGGWTEVQPKAEQCYALYRRFARQYLAFARDSA